MPNYGDYYTLPNERGWLGESCPAGLLTASNALSPAGTLFLARVKVPAAGPCTNVTVTIVTAGSALTAGQNFAALFHASGSLIAQSVDQTTNWGGTGQKDAQLAGGPYFLAAGEYYAGVWYNGTTGPTLGRAANLASAFANAGFAAPNFRSAIANTSLTTAAPSTIGTQTGSGSVYHLALT